MNNRKEQLQTLQNTLSKRVEKIDIDLHSRISNAKFADQAVTHQNDDVLLNLKNEALQELALINTALLKLERNIYGQCEHCHSIISTERLDALPFAKNCKNCAI